jgi:hypothetical protein
MPPFMPRRIVETRGGRYAVAAIPVPSEIPGFAATHFQFVRMDDWTSAVRLTLHERVAPADPTESSRAA